MSRVPKKRYYRDNYRAINDNYRYRYRISIILHYRKKNDKKIKKISVFFVFPLVC